MKPMSHEVLRKMLARSKRSNTEGVMLTQVEVEALLAEYARALLDAPYTRPISMADLSAAVDQHLTDSAS